MGACCRPPPRCACPPVLLGQLHTAVDCFCRKTPPFSSTSGVVIERTQHARPGAGGTASAQTMGKLASYTRATRGSHMPAETRRHTTPNHHFPYTCWPYGAHSASSFCASL